MTWRSLRVYFDEPIDEVPDWLRQMCKLVDTPSEATKFILNYIPIHRWWFGLATLDPTRIKELETRGLEVTLAEFKAERKRRKADLTSLRKAVKHLEAVKANIQDDMITEDYLTSTTEGEVETCRLQTAIDVIQGVLIPDFESVLERQRRHEEGAPLRRKRAFRNVPAFRARYWGVLRNDLKDINGRDQVLASAIVASNDDFLMPPCAGFVKKYPDFPKMLDRLRTLRRDMKAASKSG